MHSLDYILHFLRDLIIIFFVTAGVRILDKAIELLNSGFPPPAKSSLPHNYLGIDTVAAIVTVLDAVAIMTIGIIGITTIMKYLTKSLVTAQIARRRTLTLLKKVRLHYYVQSPPVFSQLQHPLAPHGTLDCQSLVLHSDCLGPRLDGTDLIARSPVGDHFLSTF